MMQTDLTSVSALVAAASVVAGVIYFVFQFRQQTKIRQTDLVMRLYATFGGEDFQQAALKVMKLDYKDYNDYVKKYGPPGTEEPIPMALIRIMYFYEGVGILLRRKLVDIELVAQLFGPNIRWQWRKIKPLIESFRKLLDAPGMANSFEYLYNQITKREDKLKPSKA